MLPYAGTSGLLKEFDKKGLKLPRVPTGDQGDKYL